MYILLNKQIFTRRHNIFLERVQPLPAQPFALYVNEPVFVTYSNLCATDQNF